MQTRPDAHAAAEDNAKLAGHWQLLEQRLNKDREACIEQRSSKYFCISYLVYIYCMVDLNLALK